VTRNIIVWLTGSSSDPELDLRSEDRARLTGRRTRRPSRAPRACPRGGESIPDWAGKVVAARLRSASGVLGRHRLHGAGAHDQQLAAVWQVPTSPDPQQKRPSAQAFGAAIAHWSPSALKDAMEK
jgi:hypothetical protein